MKFSKLILFTLLLLFPFSLFYFFSLGEHHFTKLPFLGPEEGGKHFKFPEQKLYSVNGDDLTDTLKGKTLIVNVLTPDCPVNCNFYVSAFNITVLNVLNENKKYSNVIIVSEVHDADSLQATMLLEKYYQPNRWYVIQKPKKSFYDVDNHDGNLINIADPDRKGKMIYQRLLLLVDRDGYWRGCQDGTQSIKLKTFMDELKLLMKEYFKDYGAY